MFDMNNLPQVRTVEHLREVMQMFDAEPIADRDLVWFVCIGYAETVSDCRLKDLANLFSEGVKKVETLDDVQEYINTFFDETDSEYFEENNRYLLAGVARFFGKHGLSNQLSGNEDDEE